MNMMHTLRRNSSISDYKDMEGVFDWNQTPLAPLALLDSKATVIVEASKQSSWGNHARDAFYVGPAPLHYILKEYYVCDIHGFVIAVEKFILHTAGAGNIRGRPDNGRGDGSHRGDEEYGARIGRQEKAAHQHAKKKLITILDSTETLRAVDGGQPRMNLAASTSANPTSPRVMARTGFVHQRQTRNNTPLSSIEEEATVVEITPILQQQARDSNNVKRRSNGNRLPSLHHTNDCEHGKRQMGERQPVGPVRINPGRTVKQTGRRVDGVLIGSQKNSAKRARANVS